MSLRFEVFTGGFCQTNAYLVEGGDQRLLIDAPDDVAEWLRGRGTRIDALLLTHQHFDHVMDAARVKSDHDCPIYAWMPPSSDLWLNRLFSSSTGWSLDVPEYAVDHLLESTSLLTVAGIELALLHVPGHSPDSVCFHSASEGICFCGDTVFREGVGRTDFPGGSHTQLISGIREKIFSLDDRTILLPGHGPQTTVAAEKRGNPFVRAA